MNFCFVFCFIFLNVSQHPYIFGFNHSKFLLQLKVKLIDEFLRSPLFHHFAYYIHNFKRFVDIHIEPIKMFDIHIHLFALLQSFGGVLDNKMIIIIWCTWHNINVHHRWTFCFVFLIIICCCAGGGHVDLLFLFLDSLWCALCELYCSGMFIEQLWIESVPWIRVRVYDGNRVGNQRLETLNNLCANHRCISECWLFGLFSTSFNNLCFFFYVTLIGTIIIYVWY